MPVVVRGSPLLVALLLVAMTGCAPVPVPTSPSATVAPSPASPGPSEAGTPDPWLAAEVAQPSDVTSPQSQPAGVQCHPCHFRAENQFLGATGSPLGPIAVGVQQPPAQAIAFVATDDLHWIPLAGFSGATGTTAIAAVSSGARTVIVGLDHRGATAWASDGGPWTPAPRQPDLEVPDAAGAMTSVTALGQGFVAGGYLDDLATGRASAAVWRSRDGLAWRADPGAAVFAGGRIWGIAARGGTIVAVGTGGDPNYGPAAAWRWTGTAAWQRARIGPDAGGAMRAVTATPFGFVAVGLNGHDAGALAWTSPDGLDWTAAPDQPAFHFFDLAVRMQSVVSGPSGLVAGGWRSDAGKGSAVTWTSADGVSWQGPLWEASFSGGQITGLTVSGGAVVAVGRTGYPDWNQASAWARRLP
jgi:hypothetical protein